MKSIPETLLQTELSAKKSGKKARLTVDKVACEYSRYSLLLTARKVSPVGTSAPYRQKFHTDDVKFVRNLVRSSELST